MGRPRGARIGAALPRPGVRLAPRAMDSPPPLVGLRRPPRPIGGGPLNGRRPVVRPRQPIAAPRGARSLAPTSFLHPLERGERKRGARGPMKAKRRKPDARRPAMVAIIKTKMGVGPTPRPTPAPPARGARGGPPPAPDPATRIARGRARNRVTRPSSARASRGRETSTTDALRRPPPHASATMDAQAAALTASGASSLVT